MLKDATSDAKKLPKMSVGRFIFCFMSKKKVELANLPKAFQGMVTVALAYGGLTFKLDGLQQMRIEPIEPKKPKRKSAPKQKTSGNLQNQKRS